MKPCDLKSIRQYAGILTRRDMPGTAEMLGSMADEIEAWRELGALLIAGARGDYDGDATEARRAATRAAIERMCDLLPPQK